MYKGSSHWLISSHVVLYCIVCQTWERCCVGAGDEVILTMEKILICSSVLHSLSDLGEVLCWGWGWHNFSGGSSDVLTLSILPISSLIRNITEGSDF